ncbi:unnamed protein product [Callosobruchus maculatus]|uniref:Uncharacterized protein n=1 Tax=Callosobruchus maculatus TaxID=64391 RepID=A0A653BTY4_CALMS|nr:unnamed protein product [Callosobruchus maculatus]
MKVSFYKAAVDVLQEVFSLRTWLLFVTGYFFLVFLVFCASCIKDVANIYMDIMCRDDYDTTIQLLKTQSSRSKRLQRRCEILINH